MPGYFIALEGIDGVGTTTQARLLADWLQAKGRDCLLTAEPSAGTIGTFLRQALKGSYALPPPAMALLFAADRLDHLAREIRPTLADGLVVVSDRYLFSSLAYQSVGNEAAWVEAINSRAREADLTILLDAPVEACLQRVKLRDGWLMDLYEKAEFLSQVRQNYLDLAAQPGRSKGKVVVIPGESPVEEVASAVARVVEGLLALPS
ncbi:MAG: dTMP kinase [Deltaproteobacteria bacterium]|nr:dTMP kinase [Deltaproteobacteria bacterium]